jgi:hypothetical protein
MMARTVAEIMKTAPAHIRLAQVARAAGFSVNHLHDMRRSNKRLNAVTIRRLQAALLRLRCEINAVRPSDAALYTSLLVMGADAAGLDPLRVQSLSLDQMKWQSPEVAPLVQIHNHARWLMNQVFGLSQVEIARACGVKRQAVNQSIKATLAQIETDTELNRCLNGLVIKLGGEP